MMLLFENLLRILLTYAISQQGERACQKNYKLWKMFVCMFTLCSR